MSIDSDIRQLRKTDPDGITYAIYWFLSNIIMKEYREFIEGLEEDLTEEDRAAILESISVKKARDFNFIKENYEEILKWYVVNKQLISDEIKLMESK
jgi:hypothetical protein